jgi:hypothetical protein
VVVLVSRQVEEEEEVEVLLHRSLAEGAVVVVEEVEGAWRRVREVPNW